jgi:hypothetical protein
MKIPGADRMGSWNDGLSEIVEWGQTQGDRKLDRIGTFRSLADRGLKAKSK